jgi:lipoprotein NlpD
MQVIRAICCLGVLLLSACIDPQVGVRRTGGQNTGARVDVEPNRGGEHRVQKGDTLYGIAFKYALDFRDIARWNNIAEPYTIYPSQRLRLSDPTRMPTLEASAPRPAEPVTIASTPTLNSASSSASTAPSTTAPSTRAAPVVSAGVAVESGNGVTVGTLAQVPAMVNAQPLSPSNSEGLPTGFTDTGTADGASAPAAGSATAATTPTALNNAVNTSSPAAVTNPIISEADIPAPPTAKPVAGANGWGWPAQGKLIGTFAAADAARQGIDIAGNLGDPVHAAKAGEVVYSGRGIIGYGELIVIKHDDATLTAYGHNRKRLVKEGQRVTQGQTVAEMGKDTQGRTLLHFELRRNGKPVDPLGVLPARR